MEKNVLIFSMHGPGKPDVRLICGDCSVVPRTIALTTRRVSRSVARLSEKQMQRSASRKKGRSNDAPSNRDTGTDVVPGADPGSGDLVPSRRQSTAQLQRVGDGRPSPDHCIGGRRLMDLPGGRTGLATRRDARERGGCRDRVSHDIERGAALSASTSTTAPVRANDPVEWPRTYVNKNTAWMAPCRRTRFASGQ